MYGRWATFEADGSCLDLTASHRHDLGEPLQALPRPCCTLDPTRRDGQQGSKYIDFHVLRLGIRTGTLVGRMNPEAVKLMYAKNNRRGVWCPSQCFPCEYRQNARYSRPPNRSNTVRRTILTSYYAVSSCCMSIYSQMFFDVV